MEAEIAWLKEQLQQLSDQPWWEQVVGTFVNDATYDEAMRLGRESLRPGVRAAPPPFDL